MLHKYSNLALLARLLLVANSNAVPHSPLRVAVVDLPRVLAEPRASLDLNNKILTMETELGTKLKSAEQKLAKAETEISRKKAPSRRRDNTLKDGLSSYQELINKERTKINRIAQKGPQKILNKIIAVTQAYASENGKQLVLPANFVLFYSSVTNITQNVLKRLNAEFSNIDLKAIEDELEQHHSLQSQPNLESRKAKDRKSTRKQGL